MRKTVALCIAVFVTLSCSIRKDRSGCPAWLKLKLSERALALAVGLPVNVLLTHCGGTDTLVLGAAAPERWAEVDRGEIRAEALLDNGARAQVAWGGESDSLWAFHTRGVLLSEEGELEVDLHKRFATVWFSFDYGPDTERARLQLRSDVEAPDFCCIITPVEGEASVRLPAISDEDSLVLDCFNREEGRILWNWDLSEALRKAGYDWGADDLADARVRVSLAPLDVSVEIIPWKSEAGLSLEI